MRRNNLNHTATLEFFPLCHVTDNGEYQCLVKVVPDVNDKYVTSISNNASTTLDVLSELIHFILSYNYHTILFVSLDLPNPVVSVFLVLVNHLSLIVVYQ